MSQSEEELEKQGNEIKRIVAIVFIPILIFVLIQTVYQENSLDYQKEKI